MIFQRALRRELVSAAGADPQLAEMMNRIAEGRRRNAALIARSLVKDRALRPGCREEEARDVMYTLAGPELYELLVIRSGWSDEQFEAWLSRTLCGSDWPVFWMRSALSSAISQSTWTPVASTARRAA